MQAVFISVQNQQLRFEWSSVDQALPTVLRFPAESFIWHVSQDPPEAVKFDLYAYNYLGLTYSVYLWEYLDPGAVESVLIRFLNDNPRQEAGKTILRVSFGGFIQDMETDNQLSDEELGYRARALVEEEWRRRRARTSPDFDGYRVMRTPKRVYFRKKIASDGLGVAPESWRGRYAPHDEEGGPETE